MIAGLFFLLIFMVIYSYGGYPLILLALALNRKKENLVQVQTPTISLIVSVFNEETVIGRKLQNALALDYPKDRLEIIVVSDNSTDETDAIVRGFKDRGVILVARPAREGKTAGLNEAVKIASGEIIVFTDADAIYEKDALKRIANAFNDSQVGAVTGSTRYVAVGDGKMVETSGIYTRLERTIKRLESRIGSCVGADGAIFAIRESLYQPLAYDEINDFVIPLKVVQEGYRAVMDENLFCTEETSQDAKAEFRRQIRITNRTLRAIFRHSDLLNPFKYPLFSFQLFSHKVVRFCVPFFLIGLVPLNMLLIKHGMIYSVLFAGQILFYAVAFFGFLQERFRQKASRMGLFYHFLIVNASISVGWLRFLSGKKDITWDPQRA